MTTELDPQRFHDLLGEAAGQQPGHRPVADDLAAGRRSLRRRRLGMGAGALAALMIVGGTGYVAAEQLGPDGSDDGRVPAAAAPSTPADADLLAACRNGEATPAAIAALYDSGPPTVHVAARLGDTTQLAILAADRKAWGICTLSDADDAEFPADVQAFRAVDATQAASLPVSLRYSQEDCFEDDCAQTAMRLLTRLPAEVAAVRATLSDGTVHTAETDAEGFVNLQAVVAKPSGDADGFSEFSRIDYLGADGQVLAGQMWDGTGAGPDGERIEGLPLLAKYPSLAGEDIVS